MCHSSARSEGGWGIPHRVFRRWPGLPQGTLCLGLLLSIAVQHQELRPVLGETRRPSNDGRFRFKLPGDSRGVCNSYPYYLIAVQTGSPLNTLELFSMQRVLAIIQ